MLALADDVKSDNARWRRTVRLDPAGWSMLVRVANAYWDGKRHPAAEASILDAVMPTTEFPAEPEPAFNEAVANFVEALAMRLQHLKKKFFYGNDVAKTLIAVPDSYPALSWTAASLPFVRRQDTACPPVPEAPLAITGPLRYAELLPKSDFRPFVDDSLIKTARRLALAGLPQKILPPPKALPSVEAMMASRYLDESLVSVVAALPFTSALADDRRLPTTLRQLRWVLMLRSTAGHPL